MKINNQIWSTLKIFGKNNNRNIFTTYTESLMLGCEHKSDMSILYFQNNDVKKVKSILNNFKYLDKWQWSKIEEQNWNKKCKDFFKPIVIDKQVEILPYWENSKNNYLSIKINPALAFGTGHHETTYMMIQTILRFDLNRKSVFDIGAGSGILSILANKKGAKHIFAIDNDKLTYNNFYENLKLNTINSRVKFEIKDCFSISNFRYDFIFANINLNVLLKLIPRINTRGTILILSGILCSDEKLLLKVLNKQKIKNIYKRKEWLCLVIEL